MSQCKDYLMRGDGTTALVEPRNQCRFQVGAADPVADLARLEREMEEALDDGSIDGVTSASLDRALPAWREARRALVAQGWRQVWVGPNEEVVEKPGDLPMAGGV
jgi:hypothetical protein